MLLSLKVLSKIGKQVCVSTYRFDRLFDVVFPAAQVVIWIPVKHLRGRGSMCVCFWCQGPDVVLTLWQICFMVISSRSASFSRLLTVSLRSSSPGAFFTMLMSGSSSELSSPALGVLLLLLLSAFLVLAAGFFFFVCKRQQRPHEGERAAGTAAEPTPASAFTFSGASLSGPEPSERSFFVLLGGGAAAFVRCLLTGAVFLDFPLVHLGG